MPDVNCIYLLAIQYQHTPTAVCASGMSSSQQVLGSLASSAIGNPQCPCSAHTLRSADRGRVSNTYLGQAQLALMLLE